MVGRGKATQANLPHSVTGATEDARWRVWVTRGSAALLLIILAASVARFWFAGRDGPVKLVVYAFSTQEEVLTQSILPAFEEVWEAETGRELTIDSVFGPSATLAGQIDLGAPADVALFSNAHHVTYLRLGKRIEASTQAQVLGHTPMVIVVRPGNPHAIRDFEDLARPGIRLLHASPRSSGGGEWAMLAEYGSVQAGAGDEGAASAQLSAIWQNVCLLAPSARAAMTLFELGAGDAFVTYEQDALLALDRGVALEIVIPPRTIVAEPVAVIVDDNVTRAERPAAEAFVRYLLGEGGQEHFADYHQRPAGREDARFSPLVDPFTVETLGGWPQAYRRVVETVWQREIEPRLDLEDSPQILRPDLPSVGTGNGQ